MEQNLVSRTCDYCEEKQIFPAQIQDADGQRLSHWITLVRMYKVKDQIYPVQKHACKDSCAANIIQLGMLDLPKEIKDMLAEEKRRAEEFQRKMAEKTQGQAPSIPADHFFVPRCDIEDPAGQTCAVDGCQLTALAHPAGEA